MKAEKKKQGPAAPTTEPLCNRVVANASSVYRRNRASGNGSSKPRLRCNPVPDNTGGKQADAPIWELDKRDGRLVASEQEFKGTRYFDIRLWAGEDGQTATKKGITMPLEAVSGLARALMAYVAASRPGEPDKDS